jgi:hypothetical protein
MGCMIHLTRSILINQRNTLPIKEGGYSKEDGVVIFYLPIFLSRAVVLLDKVATSVVTSI